MNSFTRFEKDEQSLAHEASSLLAFGERRRSRARGPVCLQRAGHGGRGGHPCVGEKLADGNKYLGKGRLVIK